MVSAAPDDWRRMGQEDYLHDAELTWKNYQALSAEWEHEHCVFCFRKFLDPNYSPMHEEALRSHPEKRDAAGYTTSASEDRPPGKWWICKRCFADFNEEFGWSVIETDPDAWPYSGPEPKPRPTAADYQRPDGRWLKRPDEDVPRGGRWLKPSA
jgi:hypothetical protein